MRPCLPAVFYLLFAVCSATAQLLPPKLPDRQKIHDTQPEGVSLGIEVPKTSYQQGELIEATLTFTNTSPTPYHLWVGTGDRSGRIPDIAFYALGSDAKPVPDPLRWYFERGGMGGGLGGWQDLGQWKITLPANQWLVFKQPGTYQLFAFSNRVQKGDRFTQGNRQDNRIELVSDPVSITITPLSPADEKRILDEASGRLTAGGSDASKAAAKLRYLGTPAARAALLPLLNTPLSFDAQMALYAAPEPAAEAPLILAAARAGTLKLDQNVIYLYATLKTAGVQPSVMPSTKEEIEALGQKIQGAWKAASDEITTTAIAATGGKGVDYNQTLITTLFQDPGKRQQARADLVRIQLDLTPEQADTILGTWRDFGGEDFLPLVRKAVGAPAFNPNALKALAKLKPDEARPLIVEDLQRQPPRYLIPKAASRIANAPLLSLPAEPLPELEPFFREQLMTDSPKNLDLLVDAIDRYGTPTLLPDMIKFYSPKEGRWACDIQAAVLRFWLRCDPAAAVEAIKRALAAREHTHCYTGVLSGVLLDQWNDAALPFVTEALDDPDPEVALSAIKVLEAHAGVKWLGPSLAALQRISKTITKDSLRAYHSTRGTAQTLLQSTRWVANPDQRQQLQELNALKPK